MLQLLKKSLGLSLLAPLALSGFAACIGQDAAAPGEISSTETEIIGGFPGRSARFNAIGALGFRIAPPTDPGVEDLLADYRTRSYVKKKSKARAGETHYPFCSGTLIAPNAVLTAEHCVEFLYGDEEFLIGFDGTKPPRTVAITGVMSEQTLTGGLVGLGSDVAIAFLAEDITDIEPIAWAPLTEGQIDSRFIGFGYGIRNNNEDAGQRYLGMMNLRGIGGNHADNLFGDYDGFVAHYPELGWPMPADEAYPIFNLLDEHEASFGHSRGNAQDCYGDSGGPIIRMVGGKLTTYGVVSGGVGSLDLICDWGGVYSVFGPVAADFIDRALACPMIPTEGMCDGDTVRRCAPPEEGGYEPVETDCSMLGLICGKDEANELSCIVDPCEGIPAEGMCTGDVATRCSLPEEGPRRVVETDCALLGTTCGSDEAGQLTCLGVTAPVLSCAGNCGGVSEGNGEVCFCDDVCQEAGDCCSDYADVCEPGASGTSLPRE